MSKVMYGINLLDIEFIAYAQWLMGHADELPKLSEAGKALIAENATVKQRVTASRDVHNILLEIIEDAPNAIFGGDEVSPEVFTELATAAEASGLNILILIKIVGIIIALARK